MCAGGGNDRSIRSNATDTNGKIKIQLKHPTNRMIGSFGNIKTTPNVHTTVVANTMALKHRVRTKRFGFEGTNSFDST